MLKSISATLNQIKHLGKSVLAFWRLRKKMGWQGMDGFSAIFLLLMLRRLMSFSLYFLQPVLFLSTILKKNPNPNTKIKQ